MRVFLYWVVIISSSTFALTWLIGFFMMPTVPIKPCAQGFCDKLGEVVSEVVYDNFIAWENILITSFLVLLIAIIVSAIVNK